MSINRPRRVVDPGRSPRDRGGAVVAMVLVAGALGTGWGAQALPQSAPERPAAAPLGFAPSSGYRLVKNWDFRSLIYDQAALRAQFHTRYIYADGSLDHL